MKEFKVVVDDDLKLQISPIEGEFENENKDLFASAILRHLKTYVRQDARYLGALFALNEGFFETLYKIAEEARELNRKLEGEVTNEEIYS